MGHPLKANEVHLWKFSLLASRPQAESLLTLLAPDETDRANRFHAQQHRIRFIVRRALRRKILSGYLGQNAADIQFSCNQYGKPEIIGQDSPDGIRFSTSHSADLGLLVLTRGQAIGVDVEAHRPWNDNLGGVAAYFAASEQEAIAKAGTERKTQVFFAYWTCKEAFIKALGLGLRYPLHKFAISFQPDLPPILRQFGRDSASANRWQIKCWEIAPGFSTAVVVSGNSLPKFQCC